MAWLPRIVGVTGAPAAGKSAVARAFAEAGATVVDVDGLGHRALGREDVIREVVREFGRSVRARDGTLDRSTLARAAFVDRRSARRLERLIHPVVRRWIDEEIHDAHRRGVALLVIDCALLFEEGLDALCHETVCVHASRAVRAARAAEDRGWDDGELDRRQAVQLPASEKRARAARVIQNEGDLESLTAQVQDLLSDLATRDGKGTDR